MNGRQVADAARVNRPSSKVLFITGFAENAVVGNGHLEAGMEIITKPFEIGALRAACAAHGTTGKGRAVQRAMLQRTKSYLPFAKSEFDGR